MADQYTMNSVNPIHNSRKPNTWSKVPYVKIIILEFERNEYKKMRKWNFMKSEIQDLRLRGLMLIASSQSNRFFHSTQSYPSLNFTNKENNQPTIAPKL